MTFNLWLCSVRSCGAGLMQRYVTSKNTANAVVSLPDSPLVRPVHASTVVLSEGTIEI